MVVVLGPGGFEEVSDPKMSPRASKFDCFSPVVPVLGWLVADSSEARSKPAIITNVYKLNIPYGLRKLSLSINQMSYSAQHT